jgi:hypothetical protein
MRRRPWGGSPPWVHQAVRQLPDKLRDPAHHHAGRPSRGVRCLINFPRSHHPATNNLGLPKTVPSRHGTHEPSPWHPNSVRPLLDAELRAMYRKVAAGMMLASTCCTAFTPSMPGALLQPRTATSPIGRAPRSPWALSSF